MAELILHHFAASPFSEKVRLMLGYKQLAWKSVAVPNILPKPDVVALTGGYRRTPFLQIGADMYCDTALIADVLEQLQPTPTLYPDSCRALARILGQWADGSLFWSAVTYNRGPREAGPGSGAAINEMPRAVFDDRKAMGFDVEWLQPADAAPAYLAYLARLAELLQDRPYLMGTTPCLADFCAYHPLWLVHVRAGGTVDVLRHEPALVEWVGRMQAIGHGASEALDAAGAIAIAAAAEPLPPGHGPLRDTAWHDSHGIASASRVTISAESFGQEPTAGELVAATRTHYTLRRVDPRAGGVHVHFPRIGYIMKTT